MANVKQLYIVSYNMHGFYQGMETVKDPICSPPCRDIVLVPEHWLTPANPYLFGDILLPTMHMVVLLWLIVSLRVL